MRSGSGSVIIGDYVDVVDYVIGLIGEDLVGIGSDAGEGHSRELTTWGGENVL